MSGNVHAGTTPGSPSGDANSVKEYIHKLKVSFKNSRLQEVYRVTTGINIDLSYSNNLAMPTNS